MTIRCDPESTCVFHEDSLCTDLVIGVINEQAKGEGWWSCVFFRFLEWPSIGLKSSVGVSGVLLL